MLKNKCLYCLVVLGVLFTATSSASAALVTYNWDVKVGDTLKIDSTKKELVYTVDGVIDQTQGKMLGFDVNHKVLGNTGLFNAKGDGTFTVVGNPGAYTINGGFLNPVKWNINIEDAIPFQPNW